MDVTHLKPVDDLQRQLDRQKTENQQQHDEIERLRQMLVERDTIIEQQDQRLLIDHETQATQTVCNLSMFFLWIKYAYVLLQDEDKSFVEALAEPDVDTLSKLQAELDDKNRVCSLIDFFQIIDCSFFRQSKSYKHVTMIFAKHFKKNFMHRSQKIFIKWDLLKHPLTIILHRHQQIIFH